MARIAKPAAICAAALAAFALAASPTSATAANEPGCQEKKIIGVGRPNQIEAVAQLSAVAAWAQTAQALGDSYSMWHNASGAQVLCETLGSGYHRCTAHGKPCLPRGLPTPEKTNH